LAVASGNLTLVEIATTGARETRLRAYRQAQYFKSEIRKFIFEGE
jgi:hypothetical protein